MAPKKGASSRKFAEDAPWRAASGEKTVPKISHGVVCTVREGPNFNYAMSVIKHPDPIGYGLASEAFVEPAGPDCIIPGLTRPVRVLGVQVWPINVPANVSVKVLEPIGRELKSFSKSNPCCELRVLTWEQVKAMLLDKAFDLMQAPFGDR